MMQIVPLCGKGSLKGFLESMAGALNVQVQLGMCYGVASGMEYLAGRGLVHRDLASRNILVADDFSCKVSSHVQRSGYVFLPLLSSLCARVRVATVLLMCACLRQDTTHI